MLWGRSANMCSFPGCKKSLVVEKTQTDYASVVGEEAHIVAKTEGGPRGKHDLNLEDRDHYDNLILLCRDHHKIIDDQYNTYTVEILHTFKAQHIQYVENNLKPSDHKKTLKSTEQSVVTKNFTTEEKLRMKIEQAQSEETRKQLLMTEGPRDSKAEYTNLVERFKAHVQLISESSPNWRIRFWEKVENGELIFRIVSYNRQLTVQSQLDKDFNTTIHITIWRGVWAQSDQFQAFKPTSMLDVQYTFTIDEQHRRGWQLKGRSVEFKQTSDIVEDVLLRFLDLADKARNERSSLG